MRRAVLLHCRPVGGAAAAGYRAMALVAIRDYLSLWWHMALKQFSRCLPWLKSSGLAVMIRFIW